MIHHSSKGSQAHKSITDIGAGAGSQSRAADTHLVIRPHKEAGLFVMEAGIRSFAPVEPICLRWNWPLFSRDDSANPAELSGLPESKPKPADVTLNDFITACIDGIDPCSKTRIRYEAAQLFSLSERKVDDLLELALEQSQIAKIRVGSRMKYAVKRADLDSEKSLHAAALLSNKPELTALEIGEIVSLTKQQVNRIRQRIY